MREIKSAGPATIAVECIIPILNVAKLGGGHRVLYAGPRLQYGLECRSMGSVSRDGD